MSLSEFDDLWTELEDGKPKEVTYGLLSFVETLINNSTISEEEKGQLIDGLNELTYEEVKDLISDLKSRQTCPIESGRGYSQTDIINKVWKFLRYQ